MSKRLARWSPISGVLFVALWVVGLALLSTPDSNKSDAKILAHYANSSHRHKDIASFFLVLAASLVFIWFLTSLRDRLARVEGGFGKATTAAFSAGIAAAVLWLIGVGFFCAPSFAITDTSKFKLDPNTYRIVNDLGYGIWFSGTTIAGITVAVSSLLLMRAGVLPKWIAWLSFVAAATTLVAFFFIPFIIFLGSVLVLSIVFMWREARPTAAESPPTPAPAS
jgi:hypothetical protein